ncbi:hypothetical protein [Methanobrevibacter filiformis]|nr:hypothetical protein [Methanobrevibacter filiformis]
MGNDNQGVATIELVFTIFIMIFLMIAILNLFETRFDSINNMGEDLSGRTFLENLSTLINGVNSNGNGYSTTLTLPENLNNNSYSILLKKTEIMLEFKGKRGKSVIYPITLINRDNEKLDEIKLFSGNKYLIKKSLNNDNLSSIHIYQIS